MDDFIGLDLDSDFLDFNYSSLWDPALRLGSGPKEPDLYRLACQARKGDRSAVLEFVDTMDWTLREESFESFQQVHGPRPIHYAHWFYSKLEQLLGIFLYEELLVDGLGPQGYPGKPRTDRPWEESTGVLSGRKAIIQPDVLERAFSPRDSRDNTWGPLVLRLLKAGEDRLVVFGKLLEDRIAEREERSVDGGPSLTEEGVERTSKKPSRRRRRNTMERDSIIASCLSRETDRLKICTMLDDKGIPTTPKMREYGLTRWEDAWKDPDFQNNVQQVFSKTKRRSGPVKS